MKKAFVFPVVVLLIPGIAHACSGSGKVVLYIFTALVAVSLAAFLAYRKYRSNKYSKILLVLSVIAFGLFLADGTSYLYSGYQMQKQVEECRAKCIDEKKCLCNPLGGCAP
ncbi:MAG: hypothetical protein AAB582_03780 [Patescibacteria group bacterium]